MAANVAANSNSTSSDAPTTNGSTAMEPPSPGVNNEDIETFKLFYLNVQGLITNHNKSKLNLLSEMLNLFKLYKLLIFTESHLNQDILDEEVEFTNFNTFRTDRKDRKCGGVSIYTHNSLKVNEKSVQRYTNSVVELLMLNIEDINLHIICVYRPPDTTSEEFQPCLDKIRSYTEKLQASDNILLLGDLNFPFLQWKEIDGTVIHQVKTGGTRDEQKQANALLELTENLFLFQVITEPTRVNNTIDLAFINSPEIICNFNVEKTSNHLSDHNIITADINHKRSAPVTETQNNRKNIKLAEFSFWSEKSDWEKINDYLNSVPWDDNLNNESNVTSDIDFLYEKIYTACNDFIPKKKSNKNCKTPRDRRILFRRQKFLKKKLLHKQKQSNIDKINSELIDIQTKLLKSHQAERSKNEASIVKGIKKNSKLFFKYAKKFRKSHQSITSLKNEDGVSVNEVKSMCEILKNQYEKSFNKKKSVPEVSLTNPTDNTTTNINDLFSDEAPFMEIDISDEDILNAIKATKINSAPGQDCLPPIFLHKCASSLVNPLKIIMKKSLKNSDIPDSWKEAIITPIYKGKGEKSDPAQYRPISLTSQIIKLLERILRSYLIQYLEANSAFPDSQHGFRPNRSTVTQLLEQYESILDALSTQSNIDIIMLDYAKAFDKINHTILLHKLKKLGISGQIGKWIGQFLLNRTQRVSLNGHLSSPSEVISGVPQGTILGPVLFLVYIADIGDKVTKSTISSYADDSKMHKKIRNQQDGVDLQLDVNKLYEWTTLNLMEFNTTKFEALRIGKNEKLKEEIQYKTPEGECIKTTEIAKDLGVHFNSKGTFSDHIELKATKARQMTGYICRTFLTRNREVMLTLLRSLVFPILDYSCVVWNPHLQQDITRLESAQRLLTSKIDGMESFNYYKRLQELNIYSAERRRDRYIILYIFKVVQAKVPNPGISYKYSPRRGKVLTTPSVLSSKASHANTLLHNSFTRRAPRIFNSLPKQIRDLPHDTSPDLIKRRIDNFLTTVTDEPRLPGYYPSNSAASNKLEDQIRTMEFLNEGHH